MLRRGPLHVRKPPRPDRARWCRAGLPPLQDFMDQGDGWITEAREIVIEPNPAEEFVGVRWMGAGMVDQIIVETICVPEPTTLMLFLGGVLPHLLRRKWRS